jgi:hypothetical protein
MRDRCDAGSRGERRDVRARERPRPTRAPIGFGAADPLLFRILECIDGERARAREDLMGGAARTAHGRGIREIRNCRSSKLGFFRVILAEFRRAVAAERRYEDLRRADTTALARAGMVRADIPRRIFEEFYSLT